MINLDYYFSSHTVNGLNQSLNLRGVFVGANHQHIRTCFALLKNTRVLNSNISHTSLCALDIVGNLSFGHKTFRCGIVCCHRRHYNAVLHLQGSYVKGTE